MARRTRRTVDADGDEDEEIEEETQPRDKWAVERFLALCAFPGALLSFLLFGEEWWGDMVKKGEVADMFSEEQWANVWAIAIIALIWAGAMQLIRAGVKDSRGIIGAWKRLYALAVVVALLIVCLFTGYAVRGWNHVKFNGCSHAPCVASDSVRDMMHGRATAKDVADKAVEGAKSLWRSLIDDDPDGGETAEEEEKDPPPKPVVAPKKKRASSDDDEKEEGTSSGRETLDKGIKRVKEDGPAMLKKGVGAAKAALNDFLKE